MSKRLVVVMAALAAVAFGAFHAHSGSPADAQGEWPVAMSANLRASRAQMPRGGSVTLSAGISNPGSQGLEFALTCVPPVDFEVRNAAGRIVWRHTSPCNEDGGLAIAPGERRDWQTVWPGTGLGGEAAPQGTYFVWATIHTAPIATVVGPIRIVIGEGGDEPPRPTEPRATDRPDPTEPPRETDEPPPLATEVVSGERLPIAIGDGAQRRPDVAGHPEAVDCQTLVVWLEEGENAIAGRRVDGQWLGTPFGISGDWGAAGPPAVAYNITRRLWLVVWSAETEGGDLEIVGRYVDCGGVEGSVFRIGGSDFDDDQPAVAAFGESFVVAWRRSAEGGGHTIQGAVVTGDDTTRWVPIADGVVSEPAVACRSAAPCVVVWTRGDGSAADVVGRRWLPGEESVSDGLLVVADTANAESDPSIAWAGIEERAAFMVTWTDRGPSDPAAASRVRGRFLHTSGEVVLGDAFQVSGDGSAQHGDVTRMGGSFFVAWSSSIERVSRIWGRRVDLGSEAGVPVLGSVLKVSPDTQTATVDTYPAVAQSGASQVIAVWESAVGSDPANIYGRHVVAGGSRSTERVDLLGEVLAHRPGAGGGGEVDFSRDYTVEGAFVCEQGRVYYSAGARLPQSFKPGDRVRITADAAPELGDCSLTVGGAGTQIALAPWERLFTPNVLKLPL